MGCSDAFDSLTHCRRRQLEAQSREAHHAPVDGKPGSEESDKSSSLWGKVAFYWATGGVVAVLGIALTLFLALRNSDSGTAPQGPQSTGEGAAGGAKAEDYYTLDGSRPQLAPKCEGILNLCLNTPVDVATSLLGREDERYAGEFEGQIYRRWQLGEGNITVGGDSADSIFSMTAATEDDTTSFRLLLPGALTLGESTMGQVVDQRGPPDFQEQEFVENLVFYTYRYCIGPEQSIKVEFTYSTFLGGPDDPGSVDKVFTKPVTSYSVQSGC